MVGANKILTVSYGTFSCTLEGFDEPFSTMKAIAEYFRDLAADDRYFGAEPPTPDAEMLHRIAEREIQRRVDAKVGAHGITLRPHEPLAVAPAAEPADLAEAAPQTPEPAAAAPVAAEADQIEASVAAKLARIRAAVAGARAAAPPVYEDEAPVAAFAPPLPGEDFGFDIDLGGALQGDAEELAEPVATAETAPAEPAASQPAPLPAAPTAPEAAATDAQAVLSGEPASAKPQKRRAEQRAARTAAALAALTSAAAPLLADAPEAEPQAEPAAETAADGAVQAEVVDLEAEPAVAPAAPEMAADEVAEAAPQTDLPEPDADQTEPAADLPEPEAAAPEPVAPAPEILPAAMTEDDAEGDETGIAEALALHEADEEPQQASPAPAEPDLWVDAEPDEALLAPEPAPPAAEPPRVRARVIKVRRLDTPAPDAAMPVVEAEPQSDADTLAAVSAALAESAPAPAADAVLLSPEAEAELARELAELESELTPVAARAEVLSDDDEIDESLLAAVNEPLAPRTAAQARSPREAAPEPAEADLSRLMNEANTKLEGPENRRRFSAIAHLKAAVAATVAERKLRSPEEAAAAAAQETRDLERYREDLTQAVRPRRPATGTETATQRPALPEQRPAPLVLVSEQRIDRPRNAAVSEPHVVRPRRVSVARVAAATLPDEDDDDEFDAPPLSRGEARGFADFAESLGARELPELLEAAAAYTARVEGQPHFSRPQIIRKVASLAEGEAYDREAGLRSFGRLLRQGKIAKVKRGQYAITEASRFFPAQSRAR